MEPIRAPQPIGRSLKQLLSPPPPPLDSVELSEQARRNGEQIGDLTRAQLSRMSNTEQEVQQLLAQQRERRERWCEAYRKESEHQEKLLALLKEAQDAWLEAFRSATREQNQAFDKVCQMWSDYFKS